MKRWRLGFVAIAAALLGGSGCRVRSPSAVPEPPPAPSWLVTIVVDQLPAWLATERLPALDPAGGFARLRREGTFVRDLRFEHAVTDTAPGHAALYTGAVPAVTGIVANEEIPPDGGGARSILADDRTRAVGLSAGVSPHRGSSLDVLQVETLADALRAQVPGARIFSYSIKDRGALFGGGRRPDAVLWLDTDLKEFASSTAFAGGAPAWLAPLADRAAVATAMAAGWTMSEQETAWARGHAATPDDQVGEGDYGGMGTTFPHAIPSVKALRATPAGDDLVMALALATVNAAAGVPAPQRRPTLLALSLSSHDYVLHVFGPDSWEAWDELRRIDAHLATLFAALDRAVGPDGYAVLLTSDHGGSPLPELEGTPADPWCRPNAAATATVATIDRWERPCHGGRRRLVARKLVPLLETALGEALGPGPWVSGIADPLLFLTDKGRALTGLDRARLLASARQALQPLGIAAVVDVAPAAAACAAGAPDAPSPLLCASLRPGQPGDIYLLVAAGAFFDPGYVHGFGTSHGSPFLYDRAVPLLARAPGRIPAGRVVEGPLSFATFTHTAAALLGVRPPAAARPTPALGLTEIR